MRHGGTGGSQIPQTNQPTVVLTEFTSVQNKRKITNRNTVQPQELIPKKKNSGSIICMVFIYGFRRADMKQTTILCKTCHK